MAEIDALLQKTVQHSASDLHVMSDFVPTLRVDGDIRVLGDEPEMTPERIKKMIFEIAPEHNRRQFEELNDTDFAYELGKEGRFRVNVFRDRKGPGAVFRWIPSKITTADELGLPKSIIKLCTLPKGLILVTGPTGSGKTTTIGAMLDYINKTRHAHVITIEDPIELVHENDCCIINQREVYNHTSSFKHALRAALREDPDIVFIGELRDLETIETAIETTETGHLVFATLHTSSAATTVERMIEQFPMGKQAQIRQMLATSLKGVVSQTLLKRKDTVGRVAAMEILIVNTAISNLIREGKTHQIESAIQTGGRQGMILLNDSLLRLITSGLVLPTDAMAKALDKEDLQKKIAQAGVSTSLSFETTRAQSIRRKAPPTMDRQLSRVVSTEDFKSFREKMFRNKKQNQA